MRTCNQLAKKESEESEETKRNARIGAEEIKKATNCESHEVILPPKLSKDGFQKTDGQCATRSQMSTCTCTCNMHTCG